MKTVHFQTVDVDPTGPIVVWCGECGREMIVEVMATHAFQHGGGAVALADVGRPPKAKLEEALGHLAHATVWAVREYGADADRQIEVANEHISLLAKALFIKAPEVS